MQEKTGKPLDKTFELANPTFWSYARCLARFFVIFDQIEILCGKADLAIAADDLPDARILIPLTVFRDGFPLFHSPLEGETRKIATIEENSFFNGGEARGKVNFGEIIIISESIRFDFF